MHLWKEGEIAKQQEDHHAKTQAEALAQQQQFVVSRKEKEKANSSNDENNPKSSKIKPRSSASHYAEQAGEALRPHLPPVNQLTSIMGKIRTGSTVKRANPPVKLRFHLTYKTGSTPGKRPISK